MAIQQISLNQIRNLQSITLDFHPHTNWIIGENGSGKTSLLEAVHILCQGSSFKTHHLNQCIQHNQDQFLLYAKFDTHKTGIARNHQQTTIRINGENINKLSELVEKAPVVSIHSKSFDLITGAPSLRREFIDWCLFHVEHSYRKIWKEFKHVLKQKNALLKHNKNLDQLDYWNQYLADICIKIYQLRKKYLDDISAHISELNKQLLISSEITIEYRPGWKTIPDPLNDLTSSREKEIRQKHALIGSHRDLIHIKSNNYLAAETLSRGQLKILSISFYLAQILLVQKHTGKSIIVLIDDLDSELDDDAVKRVIKLFTELDIQIFLTNIRQRQNPFVDQQEYKMFHVEHGMIKPVKNTQ